MTNTALQMEQDQHIRQQLDQLNALNDAHQRQVLEHSKAMLDKLCPLAVGSHSQVQSYVVYYTQLLAFFCRRSKHWPGGAGAISRLVWQPGKTTIPAV